MSNQLQITGGAKVRNLDGVITGSTGVLSSLPINASNGIPQLDVNGKILVSQLPNSVMEYQGTWNVATNTPYLVNGVGNTGDVYLVTGAATGGTNHNFGAGNILFYNGDQVIYSGSIWQRASGATGTVTSVAVTETGDALSITGSPITTSGTINIGFAGSSAQYVAGDGTLITFPTIITEAQNLITDVYNETGATLTKGTVVYINGGHGNLPTVTKAIATGDATSAQTYGVVQANITNNNNGHVVVIGSLGDLDTQAYAAGTQLYLSSTTAGAWTSTKQYAPAHLVYVGIVVRSHPTQGVVEIRIQNGFEMDELHNVYAQSPNNGDILQYVSSTSLWTSVAGNTDNIAEGLNLYFTDARVRAALSATSPLSFNSSTGAFSISQATTSTNGYLSSTDWNTFNNKQNALGFVPIGGSGSVNYISKFTGSTTISQSGIYEGVTNYVSIGNTNTTYNLDVTGTGRITGQLTLGSTITNGTYTYTLPGATGTLALTSQIPSLTGYVTGTATSGQVSYFNGTSSIAGSNNHFWDATNNRLGIGLTNPQRSLEIYSATADSHLRLSGAAPSVSMGEAITGSVYQAKFGLATGSGQYVSGAVAGDFVLISQTGATIFATSGGEKMRLTSGGSFGIGNSSPSYTLDVTGTGRFTGTLQLGSSSSTWGLSAFSAQFISDTGTLYGGNGQMAITNNATHNGTNWLYRTTNYANIYTTDGGQFAWSTASSGTVGGTISFTERMRITNSGNVGIGTSSPARKLVVRDDTADPFISILGAYPNQGGILFGDSTYNDSACAIRQDRNNNALWFSTNGASSEKMRITSGGIITAAADGVFQVAWSSNTFVSNVSGISMQSRYSATYLQSWNSAVSAYAGLYLNNAFTNFSSLGTGTVYSNGGTLTNTNPSDERLKDNIKSISWGLNEIMQLRPVEYNWKDDKTNQGKQYGFIAQEVQAIIPDLVKEFTIPANEEKGIEETKRLGLEKDGIYAALVKAIQELEARLKTLENK